MMEHPMDPGYAGHVSSQPGLPHHMGSSSMMPPSYGSQAPMPHGMGVQMSGMSAGPYSAMPSSNPQKSSSFNQVQMKFLSAQIKAYRLLARNTVLPDNLRAFILSHASSVSSAAAVASSTPPPGSSSPAPTQPSSASASVSASSPSSQKQEQPSSGDSGKTPEATPPVKTDIIKSETSTGTQPGSGPAKTHSQIKPVKLVPSAKPKGLDPEIILKEREARYMCCTYMYLYHNHLLSHDYHLTIT